MREKKVIHAWYWRVLLTFSGFKAGEFYSSAISGLMWEDLETMLTFSIVFLFQFYYCTVFGIAKLLLSHQFDNKNAILITFYSINEKWNVATDSHQN